MVQKRGTLERSCYDSEDLSSSDSSLSEVLEHAGEQSLSLLTLSSEDAAEDSGSMEPYTFEPLADSLSIDELPSSANVDEHSERLSDTSW